MQRCGVTTRRRRRGGDVRGASPAGRRLLVAVVGAGVLLGACTPPTTTGPDPVVGTDQRISELRAARAALAEPVPLLVGTAEATDRALAEVWAAEVAVAARASLSATVDLEPLRAARERLAAVVLEGDGPDVTAARTIVAAMLDAVDTIVQAVPAELTDLQGLDEFDGRLEALVEVWNDRGAYTRQQEAFAEAAAAARALAAEAEAAVLEQEVACLDVWERRAAAATVFADRTDELRGYIRDRQGLTFDEKRREYSQDPFDNEGGFAADDARTTGACYAESSAVPALVALLQDAMDELAAVLDPAELREG